MRRYLKKLLSQRRKIVCVGLGKTGTTSFGAAMRVLGYNHCLGGLALNFAFDQGRKWPIRLALARHDSFEDYPWPYLYETVSKLYPGTRFVLTRRTSAEVWLKSLMKHYSRVGWTEDKWMFQGYYSPFQNPEHHLRLYEGHNSRVREFFKGKPNFLEVCWEEGDGWEELCGFLGRRTPSEPFPRSNVAPKTIDYDEARAKADAELAAYLK